jgi:hypothetical protein
MGIDLDPAGDNLRERDRESIFHPYKWVTLAFGATKNINIQTSAASVVINLFLDRKYLNFCNWQKIFLYLFKNEKSFSFVRCCGSGSESGST